LTLAAGQKGSALVQGEAASCKARAVASTAMVQEKIWSKGPDCEAMCKKLGAYPKCQCPGFAGQPASDDDTRACFVKYCQDPTTPCPNDAFTGCVDANTKVSALQWDSVLKRVDSKFSMMMQVMQSSNASKACNKKSNAQAALIQAKALDMGVPCEKMCKDLGAYPNCQCPGFNGEPASDDDTRGCYTKYCQDPTAPCPNDAFVECVDANTKVSALQWKSVMSKVSNGLDSLLQVVKLAKSHPKKA